MEPQTKLLHYAASVDREGRMVAEGHDPIALPASWTPEHLLLAALAQCTLKSLRHHAGRAGIGVTPSAEASSIVTRRDEDGRYAVVELNVDFQIELDPEPSADIVGSLLFKAERDCFVGNSLRARPTWTWVVNGRPAAVAPPA